MGMKFEYDEKGTTFYYFVLSFCAIFLIPTTYYLFSDDKEKEKKGKLSFVNAVGYIFRL